jgi:hypothetical protein
MSAPYPPTLIYPNGGETVIDKELTISWSLPAPISSDDRAVLIEIYYTDQFDASTEPDWRQIAVVPSHATQYVWRFGSYVKSSRVRVAIRSRTSRGERSDFVISAGNFTINRRKLATPAVISPTPGSRWDKYIEIVPDHRAIEGTYSQRSFYQFAYSSAKANVPLTPIAQDVPVGTRSVIWNIIDVTPSDDYAIHVFLRDDDGNTSDTLLIKGVTVAHEGYFLIDTTPPVATIVINDDDEFTRDRDVTVKIVSYDDTTGVHSMQLFEGENAARPEPVANVRPFKLSEEDGTKIVELLLQDFGANRNSDRVQRLLESVIGDGLSITDVLFASGYVWVTTTGGGNYLYRVGEYPLRVYTFSSQPTALGSYNSQLYVATTTAATNKGTLYRYTGASTIESVYAFSGSDSAVNCMAEHAGKLYIGLENGGVFEYDGSTFASIADVSNPVRSIVSDGNSLYLVMKNSSDLMIYNGSDFVTTGG